MDILFYDSVNHLKRNLNCYATYHLFKALIFIVFIPIDYTIINSPNDKRIMAAMIIALIGSFLQFLALLLFRCIAITNNYLLLTIAQLLGHTT